MSKPTAAARAVERQQRHDPLELLRKHAADDDIASHSSDEEVAEPATDEQLKLKKKKESTSEEKTPASNKKKRGPPPSGRSPAALSAAAADLAPTLNPNGVPEDELDIEDPIVDELLKEYCSYEGRLTCQLGFDDDEEDGGGLMSGMIDAALADEVMNYTKKKKLKQEQQEEEVEAEEENDTESSPKATKGDKNEDPLSKAKRISQENIDSVCDDFVNRFLQQSGSVTELYEGLKQCNSHLLEMESVLTVFLDRIGQVRDEISELKVKASDVAQRAANVGAVQKVVADVLQHLTVPPDVIQVILSSNEYNLGQQFILSIRKLMKILRYRQGHWQQHAAALHNRRLHKQQQQQHHAGSPGKPHAGDGGWVSSPTASHVGEFPSNASFSSATSMNSAATNRAVHIQLKNCKAYREVTDILDDITVFAALKIKSFLLQEINVLAKPRTNIAIQQANVLLPHKPLVAFLRHAPSLLKQIHRSYHAPDLATSGAPAEAAHHVVHLVHYRIVHSLYQVVKSHYEGILSRTYSEKIHQYLQAVNALETPHVFASSGGGSSSSGIGSGQEPQQQQSSGWTSFFSKVVQATSTPNFDLPLLTDKNSNISSSDYSIGERGAVFQKLFAMPLVPHIERLAKRKHFYEETFRSFNVLLIDAVTSEFLFSFEFFAADTSVYVEVFRKTIQIIIDYVSEVMLRNSSKRSQMKRPASASPGKGDAQDSIKSSFQSLTSCNKDLCGILTLIRLTNLFKVHMHHTRKIHILDGYFDAILLLLWPAFKEALNDQLLAIKGMKPKESAAFMAGFRTVEDCLSSVHPLTQRYAELSASMMLLGTTVPLPVSAIDERAEEERNLGVYQPDNVRRSGSDVRRASSSVNLTGDGSHEKLVATEDDEDDNSSLNCSQHQKAHTRATTYVNMMKQDDDFVESEHRFAVLKTNLSVLRIEYERIITATGAEIAANSVSAMQRPIVSALRVNNLFYVLQKWRSTIPVKKDPFGAFNVALEAQVDYQHTAHLKKFGHASGFRSKEPSVGNTSFGGHSSVDPGSPTRGGGGGTNTTGSSLQHVEGPKGYEVASCTLSSDYDAMEKSFGAAKIEFVEEVLRTVFPSLLTVVCSVERLRPLQVEEMAMNFVTSWRHGLDNVKLLVKSHIGDATNAVELLKQMFMQILLYNTRLHAIVGSLDSPSKPVRSLVVSNQQLMMAMRQIVAMDDHDDHSGVLSPDDIEL